MLAALPQVRALIEKGQYKEAVALADNAIISRPKGQMPYGAAGDLLLDFAGLSAPTSYRRSLDLDSAVATTRFVSGAGRYLREAFASAPDQVLVLHLSAEGEKMDFDLGYRHPRDVDYGTTNYFGGQTSKYTININTEMNYWPADPANLGMCVEPLLRMVEDLAVRGAVTARAGYGARGWVTHHNTDLWRATAPIDGANTGLWPTGGAWLCLSLWDHYEYEPDAAYLKRLYPLLKGASLFFLDALVEDPKGRGLVTSPSISPENAHPGRSGLCAGPAMDRQILRDLFAATLTAAGKIGEADGEFVRALKSARARLPADRIGAQGQLQEWLDDWDAKAPEQQHRHVSHLFGVYPSAQINVRDTPALVAAAKHTLDIRGDKSTAWATAWRLALWARMGEGERAHAILLGLLGPSRTYPNMFDAHPPFQIDGNFGGAAGILEMLVQSWGGEIRLLPALPKAWPEGALHGVRAKGGVELDIAWKGGRLTRVVLRGPAHAKVTVRYGDALRTLAFDAKGQARYL